MCCPDVSDTFDPYRDIALDIKVAQSVNQALEHLVLPEKLDVLIIVKSENVYHCSICLKKAVASKTLTLHTSSKVLILVLKQFSDFTGDIKAKQVQYLSVLSLGHTGLSRTGGHVLCSVPFCSMLGGVVMIDITSIIYNLEMARGRKCMMLREPLVILLSPFPPKPCPLISRRENWENTVEVCQ